MAWHFFVVVKEAYDKLKASVAFVIKATRPLRAEIQSTNHPEQAEPLTEATFEAPLRRLQHSSPDDSLLDPIWRAIAQRTLPSHLTNESARQFFDKSDVRDALRELQSAAVLKQPLPKDAIARLETTYMDVASATSQEAEAVIKAAIALLVANITSRVEDAGNAAVTAAGVDVIVPRLAALQEGLTRLEAQANALAFPHELDEPGVQAWRTALRAASQPVLDWRSVVGPGSGQHIERPALGTLKAMAEREDAVTCALLGDPGAGKSALMSRLASSLVERDNVTVLAVKADLIDASVATEADLQRDLGLPELPSIMLRQLAARGRVYLLLDQLDALADRLDVKTARLSLLLTLVRQLSVVDGIRIFLSCRTFEYRHDTRLTAISAKSLELEPPKWEEVIPVLQANGISPDGWHADAKEVLRVPQHLNTFLQLKSEGVSEPISTYQAMLESLWNSLVLAGKPPRLHQLACEIAEVMADKEELWLPASLFDDRIEELTSLISARILTRSGHGKIGFSHQTVFDYVLARSFVKTEGSLSAYVSARMESLFVRPKVLAALTYLRNAQASAYEREFKALWTLPGLRAHLRFLLIDFLGSQATPTDQEMVYLVEAFDLPELRPLILKAVAGSKGWFARLATNVISTAMSDDILADLCFPLLLTGWTVDPDVVTRLLVERWAPTSKHDRVTLSVLRDAPAWSAENLHLAKTALGRVNFGASFAENVIATVGTDSPDVAIDMLRWYLDAELGRRAIAGAEAARKREELASEGLDTMTVSSPAQHVSSLLEDTQNWDTVPALAERSPEHFVEQIWPWFVEALRTMTGLIEGGAERYLGYSLWYYIDMRFDGESVNGLPVPALLDAITSSVEKLAADKPDFLEQWARAQASSSFTPVHRLIAHSLASNPERFANYALEYMVADERRYFLGTSRDSWSTSVDLVQAVAPYWTEAQVQAFTQRIWSFSPKRPEDRREPDFIKWWSRHVRLTRLAMRRALPASTRPLDVQRSIDEETRVFPNREGRYDIVGGFVGSPIEVEQLLLASPEEIARAFKKFSDDTNWGHPKDFMRGGTVQLSRAFGVVAKRKPELAVEVLRLLEPSYGQRAAGEAISALSTESFDAAALIELIVTLYRAGFGVDDDSSFRHSVSQAVNNLLSREVRISDELLELMEGWLTREARPNDGKGPLNADADSQGKFLLFGQGIGRGFDDSDYSLVVDIVHARFQRNEDAALLDVLQRYLAGPHSVQVWEGVMDSLGQLANTSPPVGKEFIGKLLSSFPQLDGMRGPAVLMANVHAVAYDDVVANLRRWRDSERPAARKGYGELTALIALVNPKADEVRSWLAELVREPQFADAREGAAATAANLLWHNPQFRPGATTLLLDLVPRNEAAVWRQVFELFAYVDKLERETYTIGLLEAISSNIASVQVPRNATFVERLGTLLPFHGHLVARIASQLIEQWRNELSSLASPLGAAGQQIMDLALTLHRIDATKAEGLKMFEQLVEIDAYQARETLDEIDHRLRPGFVPRLRRLPRRVRRHKGTRSQ